MNDVPESTLHLLSLLLGKRAARRVHRDSLTELFLDDIVPEDVKAPHMHDVAIRRVDDVDAVTVRRIEPRTADRKRQAL